MDDWSLIEDPAAVMAWTDSATILYQPILYQPQLTTIIHPQQQSTIEGEKDYFRW